MAFGGLLLIATCCIFGGALSEFDVRASQTKYNYSEVLRLSILFFDAQRSGKLPANNPIPWRGDSALGDKGDNGEDLTGGWYDAGDHPKFNYPMAGTTAMHLWGILNFEKAYSIAGQLQQALDMVRWPLDYLLKCWIPDRQELYVQVGDADLDHHFWIRPEDMTMARPALKINATKPGSDVSAVTAAAFALGSMVFKRNGDAAYAQKLLTAAESLYRFALDYPGIFSDSLSLGYQQSNDYKDDVCFGAIALYKATGNATYLAKARQHNDDKIPYDFGPGEWRPFSNYLLYQITKESVFQINLDRFLNDWLPGGSLYYTPCGFVFRNEWGSLGRAMNTVLMALLASMEPAWSTEATQLRQWALGQVNYALGDNNKCMSYVVGFGSKYPLHPHHRAASCPSPPAKCDDSALFSPRPNPHVLYGALVGGPSNQDGYVDARIDYIHNEVAVGYNFGFHTAMAVLIHLDNEGDLPPPPSPRCHC